MSKRLMLISLLVAALVFALPAFAAETISVGTCSTSTSPDGQAMEFFKTYVEEKTGGEITVDVYHNNQLGDTNAQIEGIITGTQDILFQGIDPLMQWAPEIKYCSVSYLFKDDEHLVKFLNSAILANSYETLAKNNIMFLDDHWCFKQGPYRMLVSTVPVNKFEDLKGLKVRVPEVETLQKTWSAFGTATITMSMSEIYLALESGMIQAFEIPASQIRDNGYCEVAKYLIKTDSFPQRFALIMNKAKFDRLSPENQQILREAAYAAGDKYSSLIAENFESDLEYMQKEMGVTFVGDMDLEPFREAMKTLYAEWEESGYFEKGIVAKIEALAE